MSEAAEKKSELDEYGVFLKSSAPAEKKDIPEIIETEELTEPVSLEDIEIPEISPEQDIEETLESSVDIGEDSFEVPEPDFSDSGDSAIADEISKLGSFDDIPVDFAEPDAVPEPEAEEAAPLSDETVEIDDSFSGLAEEASPDTAVDIQEFQDGEIDIDSFMESSSPSEKSTESLDFGDGDIDLDAFMDGESFESEKEEQTEIEEADPLDIDLDFEEPVLEGSSSEQEQAGAAEDDNEDFDSLFENLKDTTVEVSDFDMPDEKEKAPAPSDSGVSEEIDLSDFGFEDSSENLNPVLDEGTKKQPEGPVDYEMNVDIEEESEPQPEKEKATVESESSDDDIQVDISQDSEKPVQKEQATDLSSPDDSFDIDSIFSNIEDENGQTVDFSSSDEEKKKLDSEDSAEFAETPVELADTGFEAEQIEPLEEPEISEQNSEIPLDDFMGEEGFTDGGPGVTGPYNEDGTMIQNPEEKEPEIAEESETIEESIIEDLEEPETIEEPVIVEDFEKPEIVEEPETIEEPIIMENLEEPEILEEPEAIEEPAIMENLEEPEIAEIPEIMEETAISEDELEIPETTETEPLETPDIFESSEPQEEPEAEAEFNASDYIDEPPSYDMTGITVTPDDLEKCVEPAEESVPDTFEEEAASLSEEENFDTGSDKTEKQTYSVFSVKENSDNGVNMDENDSAYTDSEIQATEDIQPLEEKMQTENIENEVDKIDNSAILNKIAEELASLKSEINGLKDEFEELKKNGVSASGNIAPQEEELESAEPEEPIAEPEEVLDETEELINEPAPVVEESQNTGFFNNTDEDDTIALSGDELSNILNSAEFTSRDAENIEPEPELEEVPEAEEAEELEEEITVPAAEEEDIQEPELPEQISEETPAEDENQTITDDDIPSPTLESLNFENSNASEEPLTEGNIEYLTSEIPEELQEIKEEDEDENLETGISEQPVEDVFSNWETEQNLTPVQEETAQTESAATEEIRDRSNEIPSDIKEEIKSVLAYMDQLLENLPEEKIAEFAQSEQFETYKKLFAELGLS
ncbi:hypothetical protein [Treponema sp.]|uniref:hypothetical protein n=1 Tax=Treponema sp. TaxID=166 RepID=UPI003F08B530